MKALLNAISFMFLALFVGCGTADMATEKKSEVDAEKSETALANEKKPIAINGYISPLNISVDGASYVDSEDFYSQEIDRLNKMAKDQYPKHALFLDAEVGLRDLKQNLVAYLAGTGDNGVAGEAPVDGRGAFVFNLPEKADLSQMYVLRAYKRIGLRLVSKDETISWCYNFYAEKSIMLEAGKSLILRDFHTKVTKYKCETPKNNTGISLPYPDMPSVPVKEAFEAEETWVGYGPAPKAKTSQPAVSSAPAASSDAAIAAPSSESGSAATSGNPSKDSASAENGQQYQAPVASASK